LPAVNRAAPIRRRGSPLRAPRLFPVKPSFTRFEVAAILIVFAIGVYLRAAWPERMAVEHFDEGVYASNLYSGYTANRYPDQHLYAPPLLPSLLEWAAIFGGPQGVMWVNVVAGSLTLLVLWGMVRAWWGPPAAIAAMTLLAFNEFHIAYSRATLTDAMLCLWLTAGVWAGWRAVLRGGVVNILAAGVLAGLAWWTKYNGWLTLAITGAGTVGWLVFGFLASRKRKRPVNAVPMQATASMVGGSHSSNPEGLLGLAQPVRTCLLRWLATALVAFLVWSPWLWELQRYGGYAVVAKNHAGYFGGLGLWASHAIQQLAAQAQHFGRTTGISLPAAFILMLSLCVVGGIWPATHLTHARRLFHLHELSTWMALAWLLGLTFAVPLYRPYPRLALPWIVGVVVAVTGVVLRFVGHVLPPLRELDSASLVEQSRKALSSVDSSAPRGPGWVAWVPLPALVGAIAFWSVAGWSERSPAWQNRTSLRMVAEEAILRLKSERLDREFEEYRCTIYVLAEPGLFFHLAAAQPGSPVDHLTQAASDYGMADSGGHRAGIPAYLLVGPHADQDELERSIAAGRLTLLAEFEYHPSDLVLLDEFPAWVLRKHSQRAVPRIRLFHVKTE
jgi:dolichyl-phosphate-mannose-protein mannosyltransferase